MYVDHLTVERIIDLHFLVWILFDHAQLDKDIVMQRKYVFVDKPLEILIVDLHPQCNFYKS